MNQELLRDILYFGLMLGAFLVALLISAQTSLARLKQKNYFLNRDRERYAETLYASKDGYFAFIYPDERIRDPRRHVRERCSRRLAVILNLKKGTDSSFEDILSLFYKNDSQKISKYVNLLKEEGIGFEEVFLLKGNARTIQVSGARITGSDGNLYCDMLWFRDLSDEVRENQNLESEKEKLQERVHLLEKVLDTLPCPVWMRDESLQITAGNSAYATLVGTTDLSDSGEEKRQDVIGLQTAQNAVRDNKLCKENLNIVRNGKVCAYEILEVPCRVKDGLEKNGTVGMLEDRSELMEVKRNFQIHQTAHLEVLSALGTAFALFDNRLKLIFYNRSFANLWNLSQDFLDSMPAYGAFLDEIRRLRLLPEVSDYKLYKQEEEKQFHSLLEAKETFLHIPDGRTFKRMSVPYPNGMIFAYEDVSDRLAATRMINQLVSVQQNVLDQITNAVLIFDSEQHLRYCNRAYQSIWQIDEVKVRQVPLLDEVLEWQRPLLNIEAPWTEVKKSMMRHFLALHEMFMIERRDGKVFEVSSAVLSDDSLMITYKTVSF